MTTPAPAPSWNAEQARSDAESVLWRYFSKTAALLPGADISSVGALGARDLRRLIAGHLLARAYADDLLSTIEGLLRRMPASVARRRETYSGYVRGRVEWSRTVAAQTASADDTLFVCEPVDRRYDTPLGRLIKLVVHGLAQLHEISGLGEPKESEDTTLAGQAQTLSRSATRLLGNRKLRQVRLVDRSLLRHLNETTSRYPATAALAEFVDVYYRGITLTDPAALRELLRRQVFGPRTDAELFELIVGLGILRGVEAEGFAINSPLSVLPAGGAPFAQLRRNAETCRIWWQRSAWRVLRVSARRGRWVQALERNNISDRQPLMPDLILEFPSQRRIVLVEVKHSSVGSQRERDGLRDVLAYMADIEGAVNLDATVQAVVVAWNATGRPNDSRQTILVTSQTHLIDLTRQLVTSGS